MKNRYLIIGGDMRLAYTGSELEKANKSVLCYGNGMCQCPCAQSLKDAFEQCENIIFGLPMSRDGGETVFAPHFGKKIYLADVIQYIGDAHTLYAGMPGDFFKLCQQKKATCIDYNKDEGFLLRNAHLTAEALLAIIINNLPCAISDSKILILGYGRIGKELCDMLKYLGAKVTATARNRRDFAIMDIKGITKMHSLQINGSGFDAVINTVPYTITGEKFYESLPKGCIVIDASAAPGNADKHAASVYGIKVIDAFGLPGKISPRSAGIIIANTVIG